VLAYLDAFAARHGLHAHVRYGRRVRRAVPLAEPPAGGGDGPRWRVATCCATRGDQVRARHAVCPCREGRGRPALRAQRPRRPAPRVAEPGAAPAERAPGRQAEEADFDAVAVCNGHYSAPRTPALPGAAAFPGRQLHSHDYRDAAPFAGRAVLVVGASASGEDISREIAEVADVVRARTWVWDHRGGFVGLQ